VEHCRHSLSQETPPSTHHSQSGRVAQLIDAAPTAFYRTVLMTLYATGVRNAELTRLKITDVRRAGGFLLTAFSNARPNPLFRSTLLTKDAPPKKH
jgi:site-specific recombinase XerD